VKLISYLHNGHESWGAVIDDQVIDLSKTTGLHTLAEFLGSPLFEQRDSLVSKGHRAGPFSSVELLPVIPKPEKIVCAVRNYMDHHQEALGAGLKVELSQEPPIFLRVWRSQCAHNAAIVRPKVSDSLDWEGELAVIIGKGGRNITEQDAPNHIAGYSIYNDGSVREYQFHAKQIAAGKNFESIGGFGPWMVTCEELKHDQKLKLEVRLNGEVMQSGDTGQMIFSSARLISYASTIFTLAPGDVIITGTPSGVGFSRKPPRFMKAGDVCEVEIEGIGILRNPIVDQQ